MASDLGKLASNLDDGQWKHLKESYKVEELSKFMSRKGVYSYAYIDSWGKIEETRLLPKNAFYGKLNMKGIRYRHYEHTHRFGAK